MADVKVRIIGEDQLSGVLRGIDANLGKAGSSVKGFFGQLGTKSYAAVSGTMGKLRDMGSQMKEIGAAATEAALPIAMIGGAIIGVGAALKKSADGFVEYAQNVRDVMQLTGGTAEEASKLIQVADDVRISFETLGMVMKGAIRKGVDPSIAGIGRMSDEYRSLNTSMEKNRYLMDNFGRSGVDLARLMELGSDKIKEMGDSIEGTSRLMTQEGIESAEAYYTALDTLSEFAEEVGLAIGAKATPAITEFANAMSAASDNISGGSFFDLMGELGSLSSWSGEGKFISFVEYMGILGGYFTSGVNIADEIARIRAEAAGLGVDVSMAAVRMQDMTGALDDQSGAVSETSDAWAAYWGRLADSERLTAMAKAFGVVTNEIEKTGDAAGDAGKKLDEMFNFKIPDISGDIKGILGKMKWDQMGGPAFEAAFRENMTRLFNWSPEGSLAMDTFAARAEAAFSVLKTKMGELSSEEAIDNIAAALGLTVDEASKLFDWLMKLDGLQLEAWFTLHQNTTGGGSGPGTYNPGTGTYTTPGGDTYTPKAAGGPVYTGRGYVVGEQGPELFFPRANGDILPAGPTSAAMGGSQTIDIQINASPGMSPTAVAYQVVDMLNRRANNSRMAGIGYAGR